MLCIAFLSDESLVCLYEFLVMLLYHYLILNSTDQQGKLRIASSTSKSHLTTDDSLKYLLEPIYTQS